MPYLSGLLTGIVLTILVVFLIDHLGSPPSPTIVNWDALSAKLGASVATVKEEVRKDVHQATEPGAESTVPGETH
jgi:hypothetical protein